MGIYNTVTKENSLHIISCNICIYDKNMTVKLDFQKLGLAINNQQSVLIGRSWTCTTKIMVKTKGVTPQGHQLLERQVICNY